MKNNQNIYPKTNSPEPGRAKRLITRALISAAILGGAGAAAHEVVQYNKAEAQKQAETQAKLREKIEPVMDGLGADVLALYKKDQAKHANRLSMVVNLEKGIATLRGSASQERSMDGTVYGKDLARIEATMGLTNGEADPTKTMLVDLQTLTQSPDLGDISGSVKFTAPGAEEFDDAVDGDGWSATYSGSTNVPSVGPTYGHVSTWDTRSWAGNPRPLEPTESARRVLETMPNIREGAFATFAGE